MAQSEQTVECPTEQEDATSSAEPAFAARFGSVSAAVFARQAKTKAGKSFETFYVSVRRSYRVEGEWRQTASLTPSDLLPAALALQKCYEFVHSCEA